MRTRLNVSYARVLGYNRRRQRISIDESRQ